MANNIKGITIEIGADTQPLNKALEGVNKQSKNLQTELKNVDRLLKLDPKNTELLSQKQKLLADSIGNTKSKLDTLKEAEKQAQEQFKKGDIAEEQYRALQREVIQTEQDLKKLETQTKTFGSVTKQQLEQAGKSFQDVGSKIEGAGKSLAPLSGVAAGAITGIVAMGVKAGQSADEINTLAKQTGLSTEEIQKFQYASEIIDVPLETLTGSMAKLTKNMGTAKEGTGAAAEAFDTLGISITNNDGSLRSNQEVFDETIKALGTMTNETERDALAMQIFGKSAQDLNPLILGGADALTKLGEEAAEAGLILSQDALDSANEFNDSIDKLKATATGSFAGIGTEIATALTPMLEDLAKMIGNVMEWMRGLDEDTIKIILTVLLFVAGLAPLLIIIGKVSAAIGAIISILPILGTAFTFLTGPIGIAIAAIAAIIAIGILLWKNWDTVKAKAIEIGGMISETFTNLVNGAKEWGRNLVDGLWNGMVGMKDWVIGKVKGFAMDIANGFKNFFGIASPSKLMESYGKNIDEGLAEGITGNENLPITAMKVLGDKLSGAAQTAINGAMAILTNAQMGQMTSDLKTLTDLDKKNTEKRLREDLGDKKYNDLYGQGVDSNGLYTNSQVGARQLILESMNNYVKQGGNINDWQNTEHGQFWTDSKYTDRYGMQAKDFDAMKGVATITQNITVNSPQALSPSVIAKETKKAAQNAVLPLLR